MDALFGGPAPPPQRSLASLEVEDELPHGSSLFTLTELCDGNLSISATDGVSTWGGRVGPSQLKQLATQAKMPVADFTEESMKALSQGNLGFAYSVRVNPSGSLQLVWKRHLVSDNIKFQLGEVVLDPRPSGQVHSQLLGHCITSISALREEVSDLQAERSRLVSERQSALGRLERCVNIKEEVEADLYGKFKLVLNEKKGKIRRLMDQLSSLSDRTKDLEGAGSSLPTARGHHDNDTDDEMVAEEDSPRPKTPPPQTVESLLGGSSEVVSPPVKRRRRQGTTKPTGQPEIPRPPSITRPASSGEKVKVRSMSRDSGDRSEESMESDDLLNLL